MSLPIVNLLTISVNCYFYGHVVFVALYTQVVGVNDPQSSHPISESYLVEISLMTTVQQVIELRNPVFHLSLVKIKEKNWVHQEE